MEAGKENCHSLKMWFIEAKTVRWRVSK
ncbi:hypothetical protein CCACVL1_29626 [Corchorus capsularis]|uniref:Uncharacterized protein n=1 Tax=Corchorus capsularis TaxID=210143 RepID=A0A1R3G0X5_COCAP|nr:hypothetical protein CCACVL1_29626 [Corchorus capsularis]